MLLVREGERARCVHEGAGLFEGASEGQFGKTDGGYERVYTREFLGRWV